MKFNILAIPFARQHGENIKLPGRDRQRFQVMMEKMRDTAILAEELGYHGICMTEHHMQVEGLECTTNPLFWNLYLAQHTKTIRVGQLGMNLTAMNPIALAENIAMVDHMTNGRVFAGFSRGNTARWTATMGQHVEITAADAKKGESGERSDADARNRRALYENWELVKRLWTEDLTSFKGEFWEFPTPVPWNFNPTRDWGAGDEVDKDGILEKGGIVPRPLQDPFPPIYTPFSTSMETAKFWAREGAKMVAFAPPEKEHFLPLILENCIEAAHEAGRTETTNNDVLAIGAHLLMAKTPERAAKYRAMFEEIFNYAYNATPYFVPQGRIWDGSRQDVLDEIRTLRDKYGVEEFFVWHHVNYFGDEIEREALTEFAEGVIHEVNRG